MHCDITGGMSGTHYFNPAACFVGSEVRPETWWRQASEAGFGGRLWRQALEAVSYLASRSLESTKTSHAYEVIGDAENASDWRVIDLSAASACKSSCLYISAVYSE